MDLVYIARKYKIIRKTIISIFILILLIYVFIIFKNIINLNRSNKISQSYISLPDILAMQEETNKVIVQKKNQPILTKEGIEKIKNIYKSEEKQVFLTFDDGPSKQVTIPILDLLKQENIKATFFVLGSRVELYPQIVKRTYEEGHYIANHGYSHTYSQIYSSANTVLDEYKKTDEAVKRALGDNEYSTQIFRFPGGSKGGVYNNIKSEAKILLEENNIVSVDWNVLTGDTEGIDTVEGLLTRLKSTVGSKTSVIVLMHDAGNKTKTYEALPQVIEYFRQEGYEFKTFYDVIK